MTNESPTDTLSELELAHRQALKYGQDLARIYITERARREELEVAYQLLNTIFANTPEGLVVLDDSFLILRANVAFCHLVEMTPEEVTGRLISEVLLADAMLPGLREMGPGDTDPVELVLSVIQPVKRSLLAKIARLQAGRFGGWIIVFHDETQRKRLEYQKSEFINIAAHELRTPLSAILGYGEMVQEALKAMEPDEETLQMFAAMLRGANRLNRIINELVAFAELNQGDVGRTGIQEFSLPALVEAIGVDLKSHAAEHQIVLKTDVPDTSIPMLADAALVRAALYQLILNGINFNRPGGYVIVELTEHGGQVYIQVSDTGIGIPQSDLDTIYRPFFQVESHDIRRIGGLGLGLSIVQRAVAQLGGTITIESKLDQGTVFRLQLPLRQPSSANEIAELHEKLDSSYQQSMAYARDIQLLYRQLQQVNRGLTDVNLQLEEANKLKSDFLGVISHELRTPFASIELTLQTFLRCGLDVLDEEQRGLLDQIRANVDNARRMIDSLVTYASLLSKQGRLKLETVDMPSLLEKTVESLQMLARRRQLTIQVQVARGLILPAGDSERIGEAVWHLLHNAIKFSEPGGEITVWAHHEGEFMAVEVKDAGPGIPPEKQQTIWEPFSQLADPVRRGAEGLGLGLALVRSVAVTHGGDVFLHSEPVLGSVFGFWLPLYPQTGAAD